MDLLPKMERVYIPSTTRFGNIVKKGGVFGVKDSFTVLDDIGTRHIFIGKNIGTFIYTENCHNCKGEHQETPVDGYMIIKNEYPRCTKYISTYYDMDLAKRNELMVQWETMTKVQKSALVKGK